MTAPLRPGPDTLTALEHLIGFDTTSRNSNLALIDWAEAELTALGARCERVFDATGTKASLWTTFGPTDTPGWVLSGHTDTVPVDGQDWATDPHKLHAEGGYLYGRGTCDMKGFLACCMGMAPKISKMDLRVPIHFAFSYDEELGCIGVRGLLEELASRPVKPLACVVGEPTSMAVVIGHKSKRSFHVTVTGTPGHSSRAPEFVNAVEYGARLIVKMQEIGRRLGAGASDTMYDIPQSTAHVGTGHGGTALNIVPEVFEMDLEFRTIAADDPDALADELKAYASDVLLPEMRAVDASADIVFTPLAAFPGVDTAQDDPVAQSAMRFAGSNEVKKVAFGTEGGLFQTILGIPTIICGPGSIAQAHRPNEFIAVDQLARCETFIERLIEECV